MDPNSLPKDFIRPKGTYYRVPKAPPLHTGLAHRPRACQSLPEWFLPEWSFQVRPGGAAAFVSGFDHLNKQRI